MALVENIINVLVPLLICGLIFIYFRRRITNLEQSVDIIMKMLQTNQLNSGGGLTNTIPENAVTSDDVYVPSNDEEIKRVEMNLEENDGDESESETEEESESESDSDSESQTEEEEEENKLSPIEEEVSSFLENSNVVNDALNIKEETNPLSFISQEEESKTVLLSQDVSEKDELQQKTVTELKKLLKEKNPDVNNLSRMNKASLIENLIN